MLAAAILLAAATLASPAPAEPLVRLAAPPAAISTRTTFKAPAPIISAAEYAARNADKSAEPPIPAPVAPAPILSAAEYARRRQAAASSRVFEHPASDRALQAKALGRMMDLESRSVVRTNTNAVQSPDVAVARTLPIIVTPDAEVASFRRISMSQSEDSSEPAAVIATGDETRAAEGPAQLVVEDVRFEPLAKDEPKIVERIVGAPALVTFVKQNPEELRGSEHARPINEARAQPNLDEDGFKRISSLSLDIRPPDGDLPPDAAGSRFAKAGELIHAMGTNRPWVISQYSWEAPGTLNRPLYFEDVNLERYGFSYGIAQPVVSAAHFFGRLPAIPYLRHSQPARQPVYTLGYYRPGSYAPYDLHRPPLSLRGGMAEAAWTVGMIFVIP